VRFCFELLVRMGFAGGGITAKRRASNRKIWALQRSAGMGSVISRVENGQVVYVNMRKG
jgi:hypothetical protein